MVKPSYWSELGVMISPDMKRPLPELIDMKKSANTCTQGEAINILKAT